MKNNSLMFQASSAILGSHFSKIAGAIILLLGGDVLHALDRPNVVLIVTDDQGFGDMSCHGNPWLETPNLDNLARESVSLFDYHVDPYCTPTRASLLTGRWNLRTGAWHVIQGRQLMYRTETTMADVFKRNGYETAMFGKWHLGDNAPYAPQHRGFEHVVCHKAGGVNEIGNPFVNDYFDDIYFRNGKPETFDGYCTDVWFAELERFIKSRDAKKNSTVNKKPFFAYLALNAMHSPFTVDEKYSAPLMEKGVPKDRAIFYGMIANFDENLGRLMKQIDELDLAKDTVIIFMGDNGTAAGAAGTYGAKDGYNAGMRGWKGSMYEGGHRVACFVRWPGRFKAGKKINKLTAHVDWFPTLIDLCNLDSPDGVKLDGHNLMPLLTGRSNEWTGRDRTVFLERQRYQLMPHDAATDTGQIAILTEKWRLINGELYDITSDAGQEKNLADKFPDVVSELAQKHKAWFDDVSSHDGRYAPFVVDVEAPISMTVRDWYPTQGQVIWQQKQLADEKYGINGFWVIETAQAAKYRIKLARFPDDHLEPMNATHAKLKIGKHVFSKRIANSDVAVSFDVYLNKGTTTLQTWLSNVQTGSERGAYFVQIANADANPGDREE